MLKRTLIAVAVVGFLFAASAQAFGPDVESGKQGKHFGLKTHPIKETLIWPTGGYIAVDLCKIPVLMEIGIFVQIEKCDELKLVIKQVDCADIGKVR